MKNQLHLLLENRSSDFLVSKDESSLTYADLSTLINQVSSQMKYLGIENNSVVAIVSNNGPVAATTFLSVASSATAAPLNPIYQEPEFKFYLKDLNAKALLVESNKHLAARKAATELGIQIIDIDEKFLPGIISLSQNGKEVPQMKFNYNSSEHIALVLHTSGTTSRPKIVPLKVDNILNSARNISNTLNLTSKDRYLNIMPLFHIHGLIAGVLSTLYSGGSLFCTSGFDGFSFFKMLKDFEPTWYSGVPTMHQTILNRAPRNKILIDQSQLRFIRSSSASLPVKVLHDLETTFSCPVIEAYGMTEAAHQMTSNLLPPEKRIAGSVGVAAGPEVAVLSEGKVIQKKNFMGEIIIRGDNVFSGYLNNPKANSESFIKGWFRTGDEGKFDDDGYLIICGRLKEIINRAGEKIMPKEIDEIILLHPAVEQAVTFSVPHKTLGEEVGLAVKLKENEIIDKKALQSFCAKHLAKFKIPTKIIFVEEIPKGATGKLQRIGLAEKLEL